MTCLYFSDKKTDRVKGLKNGFVRCGSIVFKSLLMLCNSWDNSVSIESPCQQLCNLSWALVSMMLQCKWWRCARSTPLRLISSLLIALMIGSLKGGSKGKGQLMDLNLTSLTHHILVESVIHRFNLAVIEHWGDYIDKDYMYRMCCFSKIVFTCCTYEPNCILYLSTYTASCLVVFQS